SRNVSMWEISSAWKAGSALKASAARRVPVGTGVTSAAMAHVSAIGGRTCSNRSAPGLGSGAKAGAIRGGICMGRLSIALVLLFATIGLAPAASNASPPPPAGGITKIDHVVVLMQENRSFDNYFSRLHYSGQPHASVESQSPNPNPLGGPPIHPFLQT